MGALHFVFCLAACSLAHASRPPSRWPCNHLEPWASRADAPPHAPYVTENTARGYIRELPRKYARGATIADVPRARETGIAGEALGGRYFLEVPVQRAPVPQSILDYAKRHKVTIRDIAGREY